MIPNVKLKPDLFLKAAINRTQNAASGLSTFVTSIMESSCISVISIGLLIWGIVLEGLTMQGGKNDAAD